MEQKLKEAADKLSDSLIEIGLVPLKESPLKGAEAQKRQFKELMRHNMEQAKIRTRKGYEAIIRGLSETVGDKIDTFKLTDARLVALKNQDQLNRVSHDNSSFQEVLNYTPEMMEEMYQIAKGFYEKGDFECCVEAFTFLTTLNHWCVSFWLGLGCAFEAQKKIDEALSAYKLAVFVGFQAIDPYGYVGRCCLQNKRYDEALEVFELGLELANGLPENGALQGIRGELKEMRDYFEMLKKAGGKG